MKAHQLHDLIERGETSFISAVQTVPAFTLVWFYFLFSREVSCILFAVWASHHTRRLIQPGDTFSFVDCVYQLFPWWRPLSWQISPTQEQHDLHPGGKLGDDPWAFSMREQQGSAVLRCRAFAAAKRAGAGAVEAFLEACEKEKPNSVVLSAYNRIDCAIPRSKQVCGKGPTKTQTPYSRKNAAILCRRFLSKKGGSHFNRFLRQEMQRGNVDVHCSTNTKAEGPAHFLQMTEIIHRVAKGVTGGWVGAMQKEHDWNIEEWSGLDSQHSSCKRKTLQKEELNGQQSGYVRMKRADVDLQAIFTEHFRRQFPGRTFAEVRAQLLVIAKGREKLEEMMADWEEPDVDED